MEKCSIEHQITRIKLGTLVYWARSEYFSKDIWIIMYPMVKISWITQLNPLTLIRDQYAFSPHIFHTLKGRHLTRIFKIISLGIFFSCGTKFSRLAYKEMYGISKENNSSDLWSGNVNEAALSLILSLCKPFTVFNFTDQKKATAFVNNKATNFLQFKRFKLRKSLNWDFEWRSKFDFSLGCDGPHAWYID